MIRLRNAAVAAIAAACLSQTAVATPREPVQARVAYADLDLSHAEGRATLDRRLAAASRSACAGGMDDLVGRADAARCRAEMIRDGRGQIVALLQSRAVQVASLTR